MASSIILTMVDGQWLTGGGKLAMVAAFPFRRARQIRRSLSYDNFESGFNHRSHARATRHVGRPNIHIQIN
jgi:hypothetical protein